MVRFNLSQETIGRLKTKFREFQNARDKIHELLADYVVDYRQFKGNTLARQEHLREKYAKRAPTLSHLVWNDAGGISWTAPDIAIVMGRSQPAIARTLSLMERKEGWCSRLLALRKNAKAANGLPIHSYHQDIFDLILDYYEEEYLLRFSKPRRGSRDKAPAIEEVRRFWSCLKTKAQVQKEHIIRQQEQTELPDIPPMGCWDILSLIWRKVFTLPTGMFFSMLFAVSFEIVRRWPQSAPWVSVIPALVLLLCAMLLHFRKGSPNILANVGAGALLFTLLWTVGLLSSDGIIRAPGGAVFSLKEPDPTQKPSIFSLIKEPWVETYRLSYADGDERTFVMIYPQIAFSQDDTLSAVVYGLNTDTPDTMLTSGDIRNLEEPPQILSREEDDIQYVTSYLLFKDGTSSDTRRSDIMKHTLKTRQSNIN